MNAVGANRADKAKVRCSDTVESGSPPREAGFAGIPLYLTSSGGMIPPCGKVSAPPKRLDAGLPANNPNTIFIGKCFGIIVKLQ
jgi:hypothetical protein